MFYLQIIIHTCFHGQPRKCWNVSIPAENHRDDLWEGIFIYLVNLEQNVSKGKEEDIGKKLQVTPFNFLLCKRGWKKYCQAFMTDVIPSSRLQKKFCNSIDRLQLQMLKAWQHFFHCLYPPSSSRFLPAAQFYHYRS